MANTEDIRNVLERIHQIQTILGDLNGRLRMGPMLLKSQENGVRKLSAQLAKVNEEYQQLRSHAKQKELEVAANDQQIVKRKAQLSEAKTNKDYSALLLQIKADEVARGVLDDEALEAIEKAEQFAKNIPKAEVELKKAEDLLAAAQKKFLDEKPGIEAQIDQYSAALREEEIKLPSDFGEIYQRLVRSVGGNESLAVVEKQKFCGGCNHQIPINSLAQLLQKKPIVCSSCARLLYIPKDYVFDKG